MRKGRLKKILNGPDCRVPLATNGYCVISCIVSRRPAFAAESYHRAACTRTRTNSLRPLRSAI